MPGDILVVGKEKEKETTLCYKKKKKKHAGPQTAGKEKAWSRLKKRRDISDTFLPKGKKKRARPCSSFLPREKRRGGKGAFRHSSRKEGKGKGREKERE